ncbi:redoxin domain-containing protein [Anabaena subtropica]|uniref:Redoxin domain-containing protein n=1 Tax=Anabaena subtropica FACHB-260 TaxID=2692884 RepID=A0ABR8CRV9_9NOST|nr:redoxin domain-containing protein [Anabaena subtropica]MBD2345608.1 redoxin domain-containing protein [Anabaena subtropica FACHB-260]
MFLPEGVPAPWFQAVCTSNPTYHFNSIAGRYVLLCFFGSANNPVSQMILQDFMQHRDIFDDDKCCFFGVSIDPDDQQLARVQPQLPGIRFFWDFDQNISQKFGVLEPSGTYLQCTYLLDERLRVLEVFPFNSQPETHVAQLISILSRLPALPVGNAVIQAPILVVPRIFEPELCQALIAYYNQHGGEKSGFMRQVEELTVAVSDDSFKRRRDQEILDEKLKNAAMYRIHDRLVPEIKKAFQFDATRIERHIISCYDSTTGGFFRPHRDNTTKGTAHRKFAVSLNLNTGEYEGGLLRFPEFGQLTYNAPAGGAVVFSCSLLHEATAVTQGRRYAYLPFLYDDAAAKIRQMNQQFLASE